MESKLKVIGMSVMQWLALLHCRRFHWGPCFSHVYVKCINTHSTCSGLDGKSCYARKDKTFQQIKVNWWLRSIEVGPIIFPRFLCICCCSSLLIVSDLTFKRF
uniref:Uncharacterized protein n=1 Tax=Takifugu rubripes TaxID=31033 RepID=A0A3B5K8X5_TAKRU